jgi:hypothetical protein
VGAFSTGPVLLATRSVCSVGLKLFRTLPPNETKIDECKKRKRVFNGFGFIGSLKTL